MRGSDYPSITPAELAAAGQALFGAGWRSELARVLGVCENDIVMVESGSSPAPKEWRERLIALAQDTALKVMEVASNLMWRGVAGNDASPDMVQPASVRLS